MKLICNKFSRFWQHLEMNSKPKEVHEDGDHNQTKHSSHKVFTNLKLEQSKKTL